jgi:type IV secretory pathway TraG/TraD family ATPase VirD4
MTWRFWLLLNEGFWIQHFLFVILSCYLLHKSCCCLFVVVVAACGSSILDLPLFILTIQQWQFEDCFDIRFNLADSGGFSGRHVLVPSLKSFGVIESAFAVLIFLAVLFLRSFPIWGP